MVSSDLGACEWFVWDLRRSGLIDRGQLDQVIGEFLKKNPRSEPPALAEYLVASGVLSSFQAERILQAKTQGLVLGPYVLVDTIGSGSMGQVFKAQSKTDNQWYAVKVLPRRSMWNVRLARRQVRSFSQFSHPAVVPFVDVGTSGGLHYLVWPLVEGETLEAKVQREGRLSPESAATIALMIAQGLTVAHQNGIFHGLLKPSNIMIGKDGQARILDFGIGSLLVENEGESLVDTMSTANTLTSGLDCAAPESIMEPTNRTPAGDQYSLGCTIYFSLAGQYPFPDGTAVEKMMAHQFKTATPLSSLIPEIPGPISALVDKLLSKTPEGRYAGADEIVESLTPFAQKPSFSARTSSLFATGLPEKTSPTRSSFIQPPKPATPPANPTTASSPTPIPEGPSYGPPPLPQASRAPVAPQPTVVQPQPAWGRTEPANPPQLKPHIPGRSIYEPHPNPVVVSSPNRNQANAESADPYVPDTFGVRPAPFNEEDERPPRHGLSTAIISIVVAAVVLLVYILGKEFIG